MGSSVSCSLKQAYQVLIFIGGTDIIDTRFITEVDFFGFDV
jgi:hypothetical protein